MLKTTALYIAALLAFDAVFLLAAYPWHPASLLGWFAFFALALPVTAACAFVYNLLGRLQVGSGAELRSANTPISWKTIGQVMLALAIFGAVLAAAAIFFIANGS